MIKQSVLQKKQECDSKGWSQRLNLLVVRQIELWTINYGHRADYQIHQYYKNQLIIISQTINTVHQTRLDLFLFEDIYILFQIMQCFTIASSDSTTRTDPKRTFLVRTGEEIVHSEYHITCVETQYKKN